MTSADPALHLLGHPLIQHKLSVMRAAATPTGEFRRLMREIATLMAYELTRDLPMEETEIETPLAFTRVPMLTGKKLCLVSVLRAGHGLLDGMLDLLPSARVGHIGLYREPATRVPVEYYLKLPEDLADRDAIVIDPLLATGNSMAAAVQRLIDYHARSIKVAVLIAAPEGLATFRLAHPDVPVFACAVDAGLDTNGFILPGLGDAGDRLFGTR
ncbi:MAG: uracil phosphoribosyltransferase [Alphaproteobacteria bacterium]|nr:uracil phosphoribosyltransferase [Alphaproteobacteria bacterium]TAD90816.1 MAG: uracil phosphoribosyltransferase [Alphaproteobacteria bacterium]